VSVEVEVGLVISIKDMKGDVAIGSSVTAGRNGVVVTALPTMITAPDEFYRR
jgi:hypothetical protein